MLRAQIGQLLAVSATLLAALPAQAQSDRVLSDQILPKDTYLYLSFPNVTTLRTQFNDSSLGKLWRDPAMADFKAEVNRAIEDELNEGLISFQEQLGLTLDEFLNIPTGEVSFAVSAGPNNTMAGLVFLDFGDSESQVRDLLDKAADGLSQAPKLLQENETHNDTELTMFRIQHDGPLPTPMAKEFGWFVKDTYLVIANREELLQAVLDNWAGEDQSFMDNEAYSYILSRCQTAQRTALSTFYVDPVGMFKKLVETGSLGQQATMGAGMALGVLPTLGLNQLRAMGGCSEAGSGDFEAVSRSVVYADQPAAGLMRAFQLEQIDQTPPSWVKEDVHAYAAMKWKVAEALQSVESLVDMFSGAGAFADRLDQMSKKGPGIHLKHDVFDQLNGEIRIITAASDASGPASDQMLFAIGVIDENRAKDVLSKVADETGLESREFRGATIYEFNGPAQGQSLAVTVSDSRLLLCVGGGLLDQVLRNDPDTPSLAESRDYRRVSQHFPSAALSVQFSRPVEQYRSFYEMIRSGEAAEQFAGSQEIFEKVDFTTLPSFDVIAKYIQPTGGYTTKDDNGVFMEAFQLAN